MSLPSDDPMLVEGQTSSPDPVGTDASGCPAEQSTAAASSPSESVIPPDVLSLTINATELIPTPPSDPAWNGWDVLRLTFLTLVALFVGVFTVLLLARWRLYPHMPLGEIARIPLVVIAGQSLAYLLVFAYMYVLVTRERGRPDFLNALHWNWPSNIAVYVFAGFVLSVSLQLLARFLPIPKELPIDTFFRTPAEAWALGILSITLAPLMEELFFRGFLYPVLARQLGFPVAVLITAFCFALLHGAQLMFSWGPVLVIFLVGLVLTIVRAKRNSVAASLIIHMAYNGTITVALFVVTDGFRHLDKLNQ